MDIQEKIGNHESFLWANNGQYLGRLTLNRFDSESIFNPFGIYGSKFSSTSIFNPFSIYGSKFSSLSPFNKFTSTPPTMYLRGSKYCMLTKNKFLGLRNVDPDELVDWLKFNRLTYF